MKQGPTAETVLGSVGALVPIVRQGVGSFLADPRGWTSATGDRWLPSIVLAEPALGRRLATVGPSDSRCRTGEALPFGLA